MQNQSSKPIFFAETKERKRGLKQLISEAPQTNQLGAIQLDFSKAVLGKQLGEGGSGCKVYMCNVQGMTCAVKVIFFVLSLFQVQK